VETGTPREWVYALLLLTLVSAFFLALRLSGRALLALDFEVLVVYLPTAICLLVCAARTSPGLSEPAVRTLAEESS